MRAFEFILREADNDPSDFETLRDALAGKIKQLPDTPETQQDLKEIEEILGDVGALTRKEFINGQLKEVGQNDPDIQKAHRLLATYILGNAGSKSQLKDLFEWWKTDLFIEHDILMKPGVHNINDILPLYKDNQFIKNLVDDLINHSAYGIGKGELLLSVMSSTITKIKEQGESGDLNIKGLNFELKAVGDKAGFRFYDRNQAPSSRYGTYVEDFFSYFANERDSYKSSKSGINLATLMKWARQTQDKEEFRKHIGNIIGQIFTASPDLAQKISDAIMQGNGVAVEDMYQQAGFNEYKANKNLQGGFIIVDFGVTPYRFITFKSLESLKDYGLALTAGTVYPISDHNGYQYPQLKLGTGGTDLLGDAIFKSNKPPAKPRGRPPSDANKPAVKPAVDFSTKKADIGWFEKYGKTSSEMIQLQNKFKKSTSGREQLSRDFHTMTLGDFEKKYLPQISLDLTT